MSDLNNHKDRAHALLSASSAHRWLACPPSAFAAEAYPEQDTEFTREGTLAHEVAEHITRYYLEGNGKLDTPLWYNYAWPQGVDREMVDCAVGYCDYIAEQVKDPGAVILLEQQVDYSPWAPEGFGTCDCIIIQDDTLIVIDYKYGQGVPVSAVANPQLRLYALGALNDFGFAFNPSKVEMHIYQPRINNVSDDTISTQDLITWATKTVKPAALKASKGKGKYAAGPQCKFCPHAGRCRTLTKTCTVYVESHGLRVGVPINSPDEIADVLQMEPLISLWLKRVKDQALTTLLDGGEIPGHKLVEGKLGNRKWTDELQVAEALKAAGYSQDDYTETKLLSPAAMDKALGKKKVAELLDSYISRAPGAPTVVPESDKRPVYDRLAEAQKDFE